MERIRKIAIEDFYGPGKHVYTDELGFRFEMRDEARSYIPCEIFRYFVEDVHMQLAFYHIGTDAFYAINILEDPMVLKKLVRNAESVPHIGYQCDSDVDADGEVLLEFEEINKIWDECTINGESLENVLANSYITFLN